MSASEVLVLGAGAAGTAAAWVAARGGAQVTVISAGAGATELYSGAIDADAGLGGAEGELDPELVELGGALGVFTFGTRRVATTAGVVRPVRGADPALLDLAPLAGAQIAVAVTDRDGPDERWLAAALSLAPWARATGTCFEPVSVEVHHTAAEGCLTDYDLARLLDEPGRCAALGERLVAAAPHAQAWLVGPFLGLSPAVVRELARILGCPIGETTSPPGGVAGARFAWARDRLLATVGARVVSARVAALGPAGTRWSVELEGGGRQVADAVVLATGGLVGGGLRLAGPAARGAALLAPSFAADLPLALDGRPLRAASSLHGVDLVALGPGALDRAGIDATGGGVAARAGLFAAGACVADRPRTLLTALDGGIRAARAALSLATGG